MENEIKRNNWSRFFKKFNSANQFRGTELSVTGPGTKIDKVPMGPFLGVTLSKNGRFIDGIQFLSGSWNIDAVAEPATTIRDPKQVWLEKDDDGHDLRLRIRSKDGIEARLKLLGEPQFEQKRNLVEKVAYSMYEHRGRRHGDDMGDWYEAEKRVENTESQLTR
jgi:hypothetical protein